MAGKKYTIIVLGDDSRKVRQLKISKVFTRLVFLVFLSALGIIGWTLKDYLSIKVQIPKLAQLEDDNQRQKKQLVSLAHRIDQIGNKMIELKKFDHKLKTMVNLETGDKNEPFLGIGGSDPTLLSPGYTVEKAHKKLVRLMHTSLTNLDEEASVQLNEKAELYKFLKNQKSMLACTPSIWPTKGWVSSRFGRRVSPFTGAKEFHKGLDISTRMRSVIVAPADGIVSSTGSNHGMGKMVSLKHSNGFKTIYGHLSKILVKKGQRVKRGEKIALVGKTGRTTGPHLHYEVHLKGVPVNPSHYILN